MSHRSMLLLLLSILSISSCTDVRVEPSKPASQSKLQLPIAPVKTQSLSEDLVLPGIVLGLAGSLSESKSGNFRQAG